MLNNILAVAEELKGEYPKYVEIPEAAFYALLGFAIVFAGIAFLIAVVWAIGKVMQMKNGTTATAKPAPKTSEVKVSESPALPVVDQEISEETIVVITAAIMAYYEANNPKCEFTVKRIKRI